MGLGALWDPNEHPRGFHGRFVKKFELAPWLKKVLDAFSPRQFQSNNQAAQYAQNMGRHAPGGAFTPEHIQRIHLDWDEAQDALRAGKIDPTTQKFVDSMEPHMQPAREGLILSKTFSPDALGLQPQNLNTNPEDPNSILHQIGNTISDRGYSATHLGTNDNHGPGKITMTIATSPGVRVAFSGMSGTDRGVFLDRDQKLLVTHVDPDGKGGWNMMAVAEPPGATSGSPQTLVPGRKGAGMSEAQREARIGAPTKRPETQPPSAPVQQFQRAGREGTAVEPGQGKQSTPGARAARRANYNKAAANEQAQLQQGQGAPSAPAMAPAPVAPAPAEVPPPQPNAPPGVGARTEPVHGPIGGVSTEGRSASEIATPPPAPPPAPPAPPVPNNGATFKQEFRARGLQSPSAGPQRREFNNALMGVSGGKMDPHDAVRELDSDIEANKNKLKAMGPNDPKAAELKTNIQRQEELSGLLSEHFNVPGNHKTPEAAPAAVTEATKAEKAAPEVKAPEAAPAPAKKAGGIFTVKNLSPEERQTYDGLSKADKAKYLERRRAGQTHGQALVSRATENVPSKAAPVKAAKAAAPAAPKAVSDVQKRADEANLPATVTALRQAAREKKIRGFSTMNKEQLQRALLGEEVPKAEKALVSPEKLGPHIQAAKTENDAKALMADHTLADLRNLGKANGVDLKGKRTKPQVQDAILKHLRGEETTGIKPEKVTESLDSELKKASVVAPDGPEGEGIRKALSEVDPNDPESLRSERDRLEKEAERLRASGNRPAATLAQGAADVMGMRAQRISGVEEAAPAKKVAKAAVPAGHEDLGGTKNDLLEIAKGEGAPHKQAMTKPQLIKAITDHRAGKEPPKLATKKTAAKAAPQGELHLGESRGTAGKLTGRESPLSRVGETPGRHGQIGPREPTPTERFLATPPAERKLPGVQNYTGPEVGSPERERDLRLLAEGRLSRGVRIQGPDVREISRLKAEAIAPKSVLARPEKQGVPSIAELRGLQSREEFDARVKDMTSAELKQHAKELSVPRYHNMSKDNLKQYIFEATTGNTIEAKTLNPSGASGIEQSRSKLTREEIAALTPEHAPVPKLASRNTSKKEALDRRVKLLDDAIAEAKASNNPEWTTHPVPGHPSKLESLERIREGVASGRTGDVALGQDLNNVNQHGAKGNEVADRIGKIYNDLTDLHGGQPYEPSARAAKKAVPTKAAVAKEAVTNAQEAHPEAPPAVVKATRARVAKAVPDGSVGTRGATPIDNKPRASEFDQAWEKAKIPTAPDKTSQGSIDEVRRSVSEGKYSPEEGIRRLESDISLNQDEIDDINRTIRSGNVSGAELDKLRVQRDRLISSKSAQEDASRFMHQHFGKERVTPKEVQLKIEQNVPEMKQLMERMKTEPGDDLRKELEGTGEFKDLKGNTAHEVFQDALKQVVQKELQKRATAKETAAAKKAAAASRKAELDAAKAKRVEEFSPGGAKHLDAKAIAGDLEIGGGHLESAQADLNQGMAPSQVAKRLHAQANGMRDSNAILNAASAGDSPDEALSRATRLQQGREAADKLDQFADRIGKTRRPTVRKAAPAKAAEQLAEAKQATKEPAAKKAIAQAETSVKEAGAEAEALKKRIIDRHQTAWDQANTEEKARTATNAMRQDLTLAEIRQWAAPQGITGRSKQDILDKAITQRFGQGAAQETNIPAVQGRMERASRARAVARSLADIEELKANQATDQAMSTRIKGFGKSGNLPEPLVERIHAARGNQSELDKIAEEHGLTRMADQAGTVVPYNPRVHDEIGTPGVREGQPVRVISPGYQGVVDGRDFTAVKARVQHEPEVRARKVAAAERLRRPQTAGEGAATLAKGGFNEPFIGGAPGSPQEKARQEAEKAANMARLKAAKELPPALQSNTKQELLKIAEREEVTRAKPSMTKAQIVQAIEQKRGAGSEPALAPAAPAKAAKAAKATKVAPVPEHVERQIRGEALSTTPVKTAHIRDFGPGVRAKTGRDDSLKLPNGGQDQGIVHMDSSLGSLWQDLASDDRAPTSTVNEVLDISHNLGQGKIDVPTARALVRGIKTDSPAVRERINKTVAELDVKPQKYQVPENTPQAVKDILDKINEIPAYHNKAPNQAGGGGEETPFNKILDLVHRIGNGEEGPGGDMKLTQAIQNPHESGDGVYAARRLANPVSPASGAMTPEVRNWFRSWRNKEQQPSVEVSPPRNTDAALARERVAKKAAKAAPKVTQAELKNPVAKVGNEAPSAPQAAVTSHGLTDGEGLPVSNRLALENKLGQNRNNLNALDRAVRFENTRAKVPELIAKVNTQLAQAGVGPNDEPRKSLNAWYNRHFG